MRENGSFAWIIWYKDWVEWSHVGCKTFFVQWEYHVQRVGNDNRPCVRQPRGIWRSRAGYEVCVWPIYALSRWTIDRGRKWQWRWPEIRCVWSYSRSFWDTIWRRSGSELNVMRICSRAQRNRGGVAIRISVISPSSPDHAGETGGSSTQSEHRHVFLQFVIIWGACHAIYFSFPHWFLSIRHLKIESATEVTSSNEITWYFDRAIWKPFLRQCWPTSANHQFVMFCAELVKLWDPYYLPVLTETQNPASLY